MNKGLVVLIAGVMMMCGIQAASAQSSWGTALKSAAVAAGQAAVQSLSPQAQATVDQAKKLPAGAPQENFLMTRAREFLASGNYQPALDLANYVITTVNSKNVDAKKIMADAQAALTKMAQDKLMKTQQASPAAQQGQARIDAAKQVQADAAQTGNSLKGLFAPGK